MKYKRTNGVYKKMTLNQKADYFVETFVLGFGFLGGAFTAAGVNPDPASIGIQILTTMNSVFPNSNTSTWIFYLTVVGLLATALTLIASWQMGRELGLLCIGLAWVGGFILIKYPMNQNFVQIGVFLFIAAAILGRFSFN